MSPHKRPGFTLIELLIVMAIIGILIGLLFPAIKAAIEGARRAQALAACKQIETAMKSYYNDYGKFPLQTSAISGDYTYAGSQLTSVMNVLRGADAANNPRNITYLDVPAKSLDTAGQFVDPWDKAYQVRADWSMDRILTVLGLNYTNVVVAVWSTGPDGLSGNNTTTTTHTNNLDNVTSWGK